MLQDRLLESLQRLARVEAELVHQRGAGVVVGGERVGLPASAVERKDQQLPAARAAAAHGQRFQLRDDLRLAAECEIRLEPQLSAASRSSSSRPISSRANGSSWKSASAGPRQPASASGEQESASPAAGGEQRPAAVEQTLEARRSSAPASTRTR